MNQHELQHIVSTGWDISLALIPLLVSAMFPDQISLWAGLVGIPLLMCRYQLVQLERLYLHSPS